MSVSCEVKIGEFKFGEDIFKLRYVIVDNDVKFVAKDIASSLKYEKPANAVNKHVDVKYKSTFEKDPQISYPASNTLVKQGDPLYLQPHTILLTKAGVIQLIMKSKLPYAVELQTWLLEEVIPQVLCTGKYQPVIDKNNDEGMEVDIYKNNDIQIATLNTLQQMSQSLIVRDEQINSLITENKNLTAAIINLSNRMADIAQDVVTKPLNTQLLHSLAVCDLGNDQYAFLRPQRRSLQRSLNRLSVDDSRILFKSEYVPNSMNVLNKVKENLPKDKFKAKHNKITLLENFSKEELMDVVKSTMTERQIARLNSTNNK